MEEVREVEEERRVHVEEEERKMKEGDGAARENNKRGK